MCCFLFLNLQKNLKKTFLLSINVVKVSGCGTLVAGQVSEVSHSLYGFAEAGFICQDAVEVFAVEVCQPLHSYLLVLSQRAVQQSRGRGTTLRGKG